jgi:hypothetical protein
LKRGVSERPDGSLSLLDYIQLPSLIFFLPNSTLSRYREQSFSDAEMRMFCAASVKGFFSSASKLSHILEEYELDQLREFTKWYYMALDLPMEGHVPGTEPPPLCRHVYRKFFIPHPDLIGLDSYVVDTLALRYQGSFVYRGISLSDTVFFYGDIRCYRSFYSSPSQELRYLERMGVIERCGMRTEVLNGPMGFEKMVERWTTKPKDRRIPLMYEYRFVEELPGLYPGIYNQDIYVDDSSQQTLVLVSHDSSQYSGQK